MKRVLRKKDSGFTLMEMLIVVAIIAVLVAVAIPVFSSSLAKSKAAVCMANRRSYKALVTMQYMLGERKITEDAVNSPSAEEKEQYKCPSGGKITYTLSGGNITVNCDVHGSSTEPPEGSPTISEEMDDLIGTIKDVTDLRHVDSTSNSSTVQAIEAALKDKGIDLAAMGANSWRYNADGNGFLFWTDVDVTKLSAGSRIPVIRYNFTSGSYTVWYSVISDQLGYNIISDPAGNSLYSGCSGYTAGEQTYDKALVWLEEAKKS